MFWKNYHKWWFREIKPLLLTRTYFSRNFRSRLVSFISWFCSFGWHSEVQNHECLKPNAKREGYNICFGKLYPLHQGRKWIQQYWLYYLKHLTHISSHPHAVRRTWFINYFLRKIYVFLSVTKNFRGKREIISQCNILP